MTDFKLSSRSRRRMHGVHDDMQRVVERAIQITPLDFGITCGLRTIEEQVALFAQKKSKTIRSKHLPCVAVSGGFAGGAVDIVVYVDGKLTWDIEHYKTVKNAFDIAANELGIEIRSGLDWDRDGDMTDQTFNDGPHYELYSGAYSMSWDEPGINRT